MAANLRTPADDLETMLAAFERDHALAGANLRALLKSTPELETRMLKAVGDGHLDLIKPLDAARRTRGALGGFDPGDDSIALPMDLLESSARNPEHANTLRMVIGHEIEHSVNKPQIDELANKFKSDVRAMAESPSPHDYTDLLETRNRNDRLRESNDQIAGFNVLAAHVRRENPDATQAQMHARLYASSEQMQQYFDVGVDASGQRSFTPKPGLSIGADGQIAATRDNVEAIGVHFYDENRYPERYGHRNLSLAYQAETQVAALNPDRPAPQVRVNLHQLKLDGFPLPPGFSDSSPTPGRTAPAPASPPVERSPAAPSGAEPSAPHPREAGHRDHGYFQMLRDKLPGVPDDAVARALLAAKLGGIDAERVDPAKIGVSDGKIWIGATTPGFHVGVDPAHAPPMDQVARDLQAMAKPNPQAEIAPGLAANDGQRPAQIAR